MRITTLSFIVFGLVAILSCNSTSNIFTNNPRTSFNGADRPPNAKPGECYAKCLMPDQIEETSNLIAVYTGYESDIDANIEIIKIQISPAKKEWVKKKANKNCLSDDPNDCLIWCLVEIPAEYEEFKIVKDTSQTSDYELVEVKEKSLSRVGGFTEWRSVLCEAQITNAVVNDIQMALKNQELFSSDLTGIICPNTKSALTEFQKRNKLPVCQLDFETLDALGVAY